MGSLQTTYRRHVKFNPANAQHRAAYWKLRKEGKQDADLRFVLEDGFGSVLAMMQARIADHFSDPATEGASSIKQAERRAVR